MARAIGRLARRRHFLVLFMFLSLGLAATGCKAQTASSGETKRLRDFGALGDGRTDDTAAIQRGLANSDRYCLDGEGRTYSVNGTLRAQKDVCLRNLTLVQTEEPFDTSPFISRACPTALDSSAVADCGDRPIPPDQLARLHAFLDVRTLLIRPAQAGGSIRVTLDHVKVVRGRYPEGGSRNDSAGIWLEGASRADLRNVEVTGYGKGYGLIVLRSSNVTADDLWVHDLVWAPYRGDAPLTQTRAAALGWNSVTIREFQPGGQNGQRAPKFYGVRVQEQITCAMFSEVHNVIIRNPRVSHCMARFEGGDLPWQADGLDVSRSSSNVTVDHPVIDSVWEGMDIVGNGTGVDGLTINNPEVSNAFGYGLKLGYHSSHVRITNAKITNAGISGIIIYGPVSDISVSGATVSGVGAVAANGQLLSPWKGQPHSGIRVNEGPSGNGVSKGDPRDVTIEDVAVSNAGNSPPYEFGLLNTGGVNVRVHRLRAAGFRNSQISGPVQTDPN